MIWTIGFLSAFTLIFIIFGAAAAEGAKQALLLCGKAVIPSLFPFFVLSGTLIGCGAAQLLSKHLAKPMRKWFGIAPDGSIAILMGLLGGYPLGAQAAVSLYQAKRIRKEDCAQLLLFCNNTGPAFFLGAVGLGIFSDLRLGLALYAIHAVSALLVGRICNRKSSAYTIRPVSDSPAPFSVVFTQAVTNAVKNILRICGFVVFFGAATAVLQKLLTLEGITLACGFLEMTSGIMHLSQLPKAAAFVLAEVFLSWGGMCVHCQTLAICSDFAMHRYFAAKLLHAILSGLLSAPIAAFLFLQPPQQAIALGGSGVFLIFLWIFCKKGVAIPIEIGYNGSNTSKR